MNKTELSQKIKRIASDVSILASVLCAMDSADPEDYPDNYETLSTDAALRGEQIACQLRHLIYTTTRLQKGEYLISAAAVQGIVIRAQDGVLEITLPCLIPKRKERRGTEFLTDPLYFSLSEYAERHPLPKYRQCVVCFSHIYDCKLPDRRVRDYDNLELKKLLDVVASFLMEDDSGLLCDAYNTTELGEMDCTCISIMDKDRFSEWLKERDNRLKSISDF